MSVFVLGSDGIPVMPCTPRRARLLLERQKARVVRIKPFTIQLKDRDSTTCELQDLEVKIDPGSKTTGFAVVRRESNDPKTIIVLWLMELTHRGSVIKKKMIQRAAYRRSRRNRNTRYRQARFLNRTKPKGWLPPSLMSRVNSTLSWVKKLQRFTPISGITFERVKFDMQKMQDPTIQSTDYQTGTLFEKEVMEYLLEKYNHTCVYCDTKDGYLEKEHVIPKAYGGSNRISNLVLACRSCNLKKGSLPIDVFLKHDQSRLVKIKSNLKKPLKDAAAVNATRNRLFTDLLRLNLPVSTGTGAQTKYNRKQFNIPKTHALDAACVGDVSKISFKTMKHLAVKCVGRGRYSRTLIDKFGFPKRKLMKTKRVFGFATGDLVKAVRKTLNGYVSKIVSIIVKASGYFTYMYNNLTESIPWNKCKLIQKADGYIYSKKDYSFFNFNNQLLTVGQL